MPTTVSSHRLLLGICAGLSAAVVGLTGCSAGVTDSDSSAAGTTPPSATNSTTPGGAGSSGNGVIPSVVVPDVSNLPTGLPTTPTAGASGDTGTLGAASLPASFPLPPGASVTDVTQDRTVLVPLA